MPASSEAICGKSRGSLIFETMPTITVDNYSEVRSTTTTAVVAISRSNVDPKLLQVAQLFVQDLLARATLEVQKKMSSSERQVSFLRCVFTIRICNVIQFQALLHEDTFFQEGERFP